MNYARCPPPAKGDIPDARALIILSCPCSSERSGVEGVRLVLLPTGFMESALSLTARPSSLNCAPSPPNFP